MFLTQEIRNSQAKKRKKKEKEYLKELKGALNSAFNLRAFAKLVVCNKYKT